MLVSRWSFDLPAFASWTILHPPKNSAFLTVGLPNQTGSDFDGIVTFHTVETRPAGCPLYSGARCPHDQQLVTGRRHCNHSSSPIPQCHIPSSEAKSDEASTRMHSRSPI